MVEGRSHQTWQQARLGWQRLATGNLMEWIWSWQLLTLHSISSFHGIFTTDLSVNCIGLSCNWRTERKAPFQGLVEWLGCKALNLLRMGNYCDFFFVLSFIPTYLTSEIFQDDTPEPFENSVEEEENKGENSEEGSHEIDKTCLIWD